MISPDLIRAFADDRERLVAAELRRRLLPGRRVRWVRRAARPLPRR
ncbi:MAG: hypothetical protein M3153_04530 [Chloroflexota bacterium]|nr:hypothetical protein [Chloroflexota bacterium]